MAAVVVTWLLLVTWAASAKAVEKSETPQVPVPESVAPAKPDAPKPVAPAAAVPLPSALPPTPAPAFKLDTTIRENLAWQIGLDRAGFSPGLIDGKIGPKTRWAATQFQLSRKLPVTGKLDVATAEALGELIPDPKMVTEVYAITDADVESVTGVTKDWVERSKMKSLGYDTLSDALAERFQTSQAMLKTLNPHVDINGLYAHEQINVPAIAMAQPAGRKGGGKSAVKLEVNLTRKTVRALDDGEMPLMLVPCSIAQHVEKRPSGDATVTSLAIDPNYTFNPELYPEVKNVTTKLIIPPGPRNPVGVAWIGLSLPGYGIHGTPWPELIGKTGSHGCIRLANWDARRLAKLIRVGMPVRFVEE